MELIIGALITVFCMWFLSVLPSLLGKAELDVDTKEYLRKHWEHLDDANKEYLKDKLNY